MYALRGDGGRARICSAPDPPQGQGGGAGGQQAGGPGGHEGDPRRGPVQQQPAQQVGEGGGDADPAVEAAEHPPPQARGRDPLDQGGGGHVRGGDAEPADGLDGEGGRHRPGQPGERVAGAADGEGGQQRRGRRGGPGDRRGGPPDNRGPATGPGQQRVAGQQPDADGGQQQPGRGPAGPEGVGGQEDQGHVVDAGAGHHGHVATDDRPQDRLAPQVAQPGPGVGQERRRPRPVAAGRPGQRRQEPEQGGRDEEAGRVHQQHPADLQDRQQQGRDQRTQGLAAVGGDADGGVGPLQVALGHHRRDGGPRRRLEHLAGDGPQPDQDQQQRQRRQP